MRMKNKDILKIGGIIFLVFALVWAVYWFFLQEENSENQGGSNGPEEPVMAAEEFEDFPIETLDGEPSSIEEQEGKPTLLTFWEQEDEESQEQLLILDNLMMLLEEDVAFLSVFEPENRQVPYTVVIDAEGGIYRQYWELVTEEVLLSDVEELLERDGF